VDVTDNTPATATRLSPLLLILIAAVFQGWMLYGLHTAIDRSLWPSTNRPLLLGLYTIALFAPTTIQLLAQHNGKTALWLLVAAMGAAFFYFGWYHGASIAGELTFTGPPVDQLANIVTLVVVWLMVLPFFGNRLIRGAWRADYSMLFVQAWRNKLLLAEAALFTGLFWLLLFLWGILFKLLGIGFFEELFKEPLFAYPVTALVFGLALYLIGSVDRFVGVVLEQILGLLKWLGVIAGLILTLFSVTLIFKLPGLVATGTRVISAAWLLWLLAVMVLLLNAAYRDGTGTRPYPSLIATALRLVSPLMVVVAVVALYALAVRISSYGLTIERFWAVVVALAALAYAIGYAVSAWRATPWMSGMGRVNVCVALGLICVLALAMTPVLSPYRLSANSQYARILANDIAPTQIATGGQPQRATTDGFRYLRFASGRYGRQRLEQLATLEDHPQATTIRERANAMLKASDYWPPVVAPFAVEQLALFPAGRTLEPGLLALLTGPTADTTPALEPSRATSMCAGNVAECAGVFVDLNADGTEEFLLVSRNTSQLFVREDSGWRREVAAGLSVALPWDAVLRALEANDFSASPRPYQDLRIGTQVLQIFTGSRGRADETVPAAGP
jgi:Domain of unknown function (DUF4153)